MKTREYMAAAKKALGGVSDYALAKHLHLTRSAVSLLVNGHIIMSVTTAAKIAELLELDPLQVIADAELERATRPEQRRLWERIRDAAVVAVMAIGAASFGVVPVPAQAGFNNNPIVSGTEYTLCAKRRARWWQALLGGRA